MPVGNLPEDVGTEPFAEFHHPLLTAGRTEMAALAGEDQNIFMMAIPALYPGKAVVQVATVQVSRDSKNPEACPGDGQYLIRHRSCFCQRSNPDGRSRNPPLRRDESRRIQAPLPLPIAGRTGHNHRSLQLQQILLHLQPPRACVRNSCTAFKALSPGQLPGELRKAGQHLIFFPQGTFNGAEG